MDRASPGRLSSLVEKVKLGQTLAMLSSRGVYRVGSVHSAGECPGGSVDQRRWNRDVK